MRQVLIWACQVALVFTGAAVVETTQGASAQVALAAAQAPDSYRPASGVRFNDPYSRDGHSKNAIKSHVIRTVNSVTRGSTIRIASWNLRGSRWTKALDAADNRGVTVRIIMGASNAAPITPNPDATWLKRHLRDDNDRLPPEKRSWLRLCEESCRGFGGIAHTKFFLFDDVQGLPDVIMYGSANATQLSADVQWNDMFTITRHGALFDTFVKVFAEMSVDKGKNPAYLQTALAKAGARIGTIGFYPYTGKVPSENPDPILGLLNRTRCSGATGGHGVDGHTKIRIGQDALWGERGKAIAERLATMKRRGCNIKIVYTLFGNEVLRILRAAKVPLVHMAYDVNRDGEYDHYLHMKVMAISGVVGDKTNASVVTNGSANWTELPLHSDEVTAQIWDDALTHDYVTWIDWMFNHRPADWVEPDLAPVDSDTVECDCRRLPTSAPDPYRLVKQDL